MDVLWGAWIKQVNFDQWQRLADLIGIYDMIHKEKKSDFPFISDLHVILAYEASLAECTKSFKITLEIIDLDATHRIFELNGEITVPQGDMPLRWYEYYVLENVIIREPGYYELSVSIDGQSKQRVPLWVTAPKLWIMDGDITTEMWDDDFERWKQEYGKE
jgi:hypothetical protein